VVGAGQEAVRHDAVGRRLDAGDGSVLDVLTAGVAVPAEDAERAGEVGLREVDELVPRHGVIARRVERSVRIAATLTVLLAIVDRAAVGQDGLPLGRAAVSEDGVELGDDVAEAVVAGTGKGRRGARDSEVCPCTGHGRERRAPVGRAAPDAARSRLSSVSSARPTSYHSGPTGGRKAR